jgi:hypothetical protein
MYRPVDRSYHEAVALNQRAHDVQNKIRSLVAAAAMTDQHQWPPTRDCRWRPDNAGNLPALDFERKVILDGAIARAKRARRFNYFQAHVSSLSLLFVSCMFQHPHAFHHFAGWQRHHSKTIRVWADIYGHFPNVSR